MNIDFKINGKILETERLILRPFRYEDLNDFFEYASVEGVGERAGWRHHANIDESKKILDNFINDDKTFAIVNKKNNKVIGSLGVEKYRYLDAFKELEGLKGREIGYVLAKEFWGMGIMPEAVSCVIDYLFNSLDLDFLICGYYAFNNQSRTVQEKCGFRQITSHTFETRMGTKETGMYTLLLNPKKNIKWPTSL